MAIGCALVELAIGGRIAKVVRKGAANISIILDNGWSKIYKSSLCSLYSGT